MSNSYSVAERKEIAKKYKQLLTVFKSKDNPEKVKKVKKAFLFAVEAHQYQRRKTGEPYIHHPIEVAHIVANEIGLGSTSVICALLHDVVEDTDYTLEDIEKYFGAKVSKIIDGLTKISSAFNQNSESLQAENFRKMLLTLSDDVRVILVKLADRLHNMRTLGAMPKQKQLKIASETVFMYAPLAHRLGLYNVKSELEDLSLMYREPEIYDMIKLKLKKTDEVLTRFITKFSNPINQKLVDLGLNFELKTRSKTIFSIWNKMMKKSIPFEEVYDLFALRIIIDSPSELEKSDCWKVYSVISDLYKPNPDRLRDWISTPRANGYESLHTTVMSPTGKWVEIQIRSKRMDEVAEKGYAAHWKYKTESNKDEGFENWIAKIREILENPEPDALDFIDDFKLNLFSEEIFVFTPKGDLKTLPVKATALDFAYEIHTKVGDHCLAAKVNQKLVPLSFELHSGDQIEIITSKSQYPHSDWLLYVTTGKAKSKIKSSLKELKKQSALKGKEKLEKEFQKLGVEFNKENCITARLFFDVISIQEMYIRIAKENLNPEKINELVIENGNFVRTKKKIRTKLENIVTNVRGKADLLVIGESTEDIDYEISACCKPIPGDDVFGFTTLKEGIKIHRTNCPNAVKLMANYAYRIIKAKWTNDAILVFLAGLRVEAVDGPGLLNKITDAISNKSSGNLRSMSCDVHDGIFVADFTVYVHDLTHLNFMIDRLNEIPDIKLVKRVE